MLNFSVSVRFLLRSSVTSRPHSLYSTLPSWLSWLYVGFCIDKKYLLKPYFMFRSEFVAGAPTAPPASPTLTPTGVPTQVPTQIPTSSPTLTPTGVPTQEPTPIPTAPSPTLSDAIAGCPQRTNTTPCVHVMQLKLRKTTGGLGAVAPQQQSPKLFQPFKPI